MIFVDEPFVTISANDAERCVEVVVKDFAEGKPYRDAMLKGLELLKKKGYARWFADMRRAAVIDPADAKWLSEDWTRAGKKAGLERIAMVMPERALSAMQMNRLTKGDAGQKVKELAIESQMFGSLDEARAWLRDG